MKHAQKWRNLLVTSIICSIAFVGCTKTENGVQEEVTPTAPVVTPVVSNESIYNNAYEEYNHLAELGVIINSPTEEDLQRLNILEEYTYDSNSSSKILIIPKYNGTKITVSTVEYTGERYIEKEVLYSVDSTKEGYGLLLETDRPEGTAQIAIYITYEGKSLEYPIVASKEGKTGNEYLKIDTEDTKPQEGTVITPEVDANTYLAGLNCFSRYDIDIDKDGNSESVEVYCQGQVDDEGHYLLDDGQEWTLILRRDNQIYPLFERSYIQLGGLEYTIYEDYDDYGRLHIIVTYNTGAAIMYYDCTYDEESGFIRRESLYEASNISKLKEWSYKNCN